MAKKAQKGGKIAIPFLITTLVSLIIIGIPALYYYDKITTRNEEIKNSNNTNEYVPEASDSGNMLFVLDFKDDNLVNTYFVLRSEPLSREFTLVPFLNSTEVTLDGKTQSLNDFYVGQGITSAEKAIESTFDITIDKYVKLDDISFQKLCDIFGGASYNVPSGLKGFNAGEQYLSSEQIQNIITHYAFADEEQRVYYAGGILTAMINQTLGERIAGSLDANFNSFMNVVQETDITSIDYNSAKNKIIYMFEEDKYTAQFKNPTGSWEDKLYKMNEDDKSEVKEWLSSDE